MDDLQLMRRFLPLFVILLPLLGSVAVYLCGSFSNRLRDIAVVAITGLTFFLLLFFYPLIQKQLVIYEVKEILDYGLKFSIDMTGFLFAFLISLLWFCSSIYAIEYMSYEKNQNRFYFFFLLVFGGSLGTVLAGNLFTLFVFFELMSLGSYVLVVHKEDLPSLSAAKKYLFMSIAGGLSLLMGIFLCYYYTGSLDIRPLAQELSYLGRGRYFIAFFFLLGFGVKAGMIPVHIWLPEAHPVAPSPASALLSGIMIKVGVYGLIRSVNVIFSPSLQQIKEGIYDFDMAGNLGYALIIIGIITMFGGAFLALFQVSMKKILAYSSVSQIGYIIMGVGVAGYMMGDGFIGLGASFYHIFSHAFFKANLFLIAGIIYVKAHELNIYQLGGLYRKMPFTTLAFLVSMFGIIGMPGFTGYISKTLLHDALIEAYRFQGSQVLYYGEKIFKLTSALTVAYFMKMLVPVFFGPSSPKLHHLDERSYSMKMSILVLSVGIILMGIFPGLLIGSFITGTSMDFSFHYSTSIHEVTFFTSYPLKGSMAAIIAGLAIYLLFLVSHLFDLVLPKKLGLENLFYRPLYRFFFYLSEIFVNLFDKKVDIAQQKTAQLFMSLIKIFVPLFDDQTMEEKGKRDKDNKEEHPFLYRFSRIFSNLIDEDFVDEKNIPTEKNIGEKNIGMEGSHNPDEDASKKQIRSFKELISFFRNYGFRSEYDHVHWDVKNLDFGIFVIIFFLLLFLLVFFPSIYRM